MMDDRVKRYLEHLRDGRWHRKLPESIGVGVWQACLHLKLIVEKRRVSRTRPGTIFVSCRIGAKGRRVLKSGRSPDRKAVTRAIHHTMCAGSFCRHAVMRA